MEQVIFGGYYSNASSSVAAYNALMGGYTWTATETYREQLVSTGGVIKNLRVKLATAPGNGKSRVFTLRVNGAASDDGGGNPLQVTIADTATSGADTTYEITVAAGDRVCLESVPSGTPDTSVARWTAMFEGSTAKESLVLSSSNNAVSSSATEYGSVAGGYWLWYATEARNYQMCAATGKIKNLYVKLSVDPGTSPDAYRFTLRVNGADSDDGEGNPLQVSITADGTTGNDTTHEIPISAGDILSIKCEPLNSPSASPYVNLGMTFEATTDGESPVIAGSYNPINTSTKEYNYLVANYLYVWSSTESQRYMLGQQCTLKNLYVKLQNAPGADTSFAFTARYSGFSSDIVATIADTATTGNDTVHTLSVLDDHDMTVECAPTDSPTVGMAYWGLVCFITPLAVGWTGELGGATIATGYEICGVSQANIAEICGVA